MKKIWLLMPVTLLLLAFAAQAAEMNGEEIFTRNCARCHGISGDAPGRPQLKGQAPADIEKKLLGYQQGTYGGNRKKTMEEMAGKLGPEQVKAVGAYIGTLPGKE